mgnify:CR=1 FL=1
MFPRSGYSRFMPGSGRKYEAVFSRAEGKEGIMEDIHNGTTPPLSSCTKMVQNGTENEW